MQTVAQRSSLGGPSQLAWQNKQRVVAAVRRSGGLTRADIARLSGLSKAAVTIITQALLKQGLLVEQESQPRERAAAAGIGRPGMLLALNPSYALAVGLEISDNHIYAVSLDLAGQPHTHAGCRFAPDADPPTVLRLLAEAAREVIVGLGEDARLVRGVGVAVPGLVNTTSGVSLWVPGMPHWRDVPVAQALQDLLGLQVLLDWRTHAATLAEQWYGVGRDHDTFLYVNVGSEVGAGLVLDGDVVHGATGMAGMLGYMRAPCLARLFDAQCTCGNASCLQMLVSTSALIRRAERALAAGILTSIRPSNDEGGADLSFTDIVDAARTGDRFACNLIESAGEALGSAIGDLVYLLNPPLIVVGGSLSRAGDLVLEPIRRAARRALLTPLYEATTIVLSDLRPGPVVLGAATLVLRTALACALDGRNGMASNSTVPLAG